MMTNHWNHNASQVQAGHGGVQSTTALALSEWAAQNFFLSSESSYVVGIWKAYPYQVGILDFFGNDDITEVSFKKAARTDPPKLCWQHQPISRSIAS